MQPNWLIATMLEPGEEWNKADDGRLPESTNSMGEVSSVDGTLAVDGNSRTFWEVNQRGDQCP